MAGLKITPTKAGSTASSSGKARHLEETQRAAATARQVLSGIAAIISGWHYGLARVDFLRHKLASEHHGDGAQSAQRFFVLEIEGILQDLDSQVGQLSFADKPLIGADAQPFQLPLAPQPSDKDSKLLSLPMIAGMELTSAALGVTAEGLINDEAQVGGELGATAAHSPSSPTSPTALAPLRVIAQGELGPEAPALPTSQRQAAEQHLAAQQATLRQAEGVVDRITSQANVFAENLSAARSQFSAAHYGRDLAKVTTALMLAQPSATAAMAGRLHRIHDRVFWGE